MANTPDDVDVPSATPEALLHKIGTLWILFGAMITSLGNEDPNLIDRMLTVLEQTKPIGMFSEDGPVKWDVVFHRSFILRKVPWSSATSLRSPRCSAITLRFQE